MNERIEELIKQASKENWCTNPYNGSPEFDGYELDPKKFAELIVQECADLVDLGASSATDIKKHFGVE